jgi:hypothetical protein
MSKYDDTVISKRTSIFFAALSSVRCAWADFARAGACHFPLSKPTWRLEKEKKGAKIEKTAIGARHPVNCNIYISP